MIRVRFPADAKSFFISLYLVLGSDKLADLIGEGMTLGHIVVVQLSAHHVPGHGVEPDLVEVDEESLGGVQLRVLLRLARP